MTNNLTEQEFSKHVGSQFEASLGERTVTLKLVEVEAYMPDPTEEKGMERFSIFFDGPPEVMLPQQTYSLRHAQMGEFEVFLGAISGDASGFRYEAVFNYYR